MYKNNKHWLQTLLIYSNDDNENSGFLSVPRQCEKTENYTL